LNTTKPKGGAAFITDFERKELLSITHGNANPEAPTNQRGAIVLNREPTRALPKIEEEHNDLPKFEDD
jgi:hypothetical protein